MILTLIKAEYISTTFLPEKVSGQFWVKDFDEKGHQINLISIEGIDNYWYIKTEIYAKIIDKNGNIVPVCKIEPLNFYEIQIDGYDGKVVLFVEPITNDRNQFTKYTVLPNTQINIGRLKSNELVYDNQVVSSVHARIEFSNNEWFVTDNNSTNGTFVNGIGVIGSKKLSLGDIIYIMGLKIVIGINFISVNNPDGQVSMLSNRVVPFKVIAKSPINNFSMNKSERNYIYRAPRFKRELIPCEIKVDAPPNNQIGEEMPMLLMIGPSATMGMAALTTGIFAVNNAITTGNITAAIPSAVMSLSMLLGTVMWPIISKKYDKKRRRRKEAHRQEKYTAYLCDINEKIEAEKEFQSTILHENNITLGECVKFIKSSSNRLWERNSSHNDFLNVRLGIGNLPLLSEIKYPERRFNLEDDNLLEDMYNLCEEPKIIENVPISFSLIKNYITGIFGDIKECKAFMKGLIIQLSALYGYDDLKMVFIYDDADFDFVRWLPHTWDNEGKIHLIAKNHDELKEVSAYLDKQICDRKALEENAIKKAKPYYIVFSLNHNLTQKSETLKQIYNLDKNINVSVINLCEDIKNLPKECISIIELNSQKGFLLNKNNISGKATMFLPDISFNNDPTDLSVKLANTYIDDPISHNKLPQLITFLDMYNVGKVEHLNVLSRWKENDPTKSLQAPIGVNVYGDKFYLDLHEKFHGPHGLIAGMTGSGKSEFVMTYILSLALNFSPEEVAFILIDYKGGGMAKAFEHLPHVAGIITNLDGAAIKRSLVSIESELKHRQSIFAKTSKDLGISNIDIYKYQKAYRDGRVSEPLPHLFIISDEFAELKTQQQEFMTQLISAARIGRSLGVHLILATQKPSGVVDDQIWSNSRFRVCLKVQERSDSMDMLKRPDAAELSDTGRFYLQVGYNELFEMGQSAWAGAPYYPLDSLNKSEEPEVDVIDNNGHLVQIVKLSNKNKSSNPSKQLDEITKYLKNISANENINVKPLWLEPIESQIFVDSIRRKYQVKCATYQLNPVVGEFDIPAQQSRDVLTVPITERGNVVVYGANGSGKTTFVTTMLYDLLKNHATENLNLYILDFASETLKAFERAPQVGDVILSYESEKILNLFKMLKSEIISRKKLFSDYGGELSSYCRETNNDIPNILIVINNYSVFSELYESCEEDIMYLSREGTKYGIYFVVTATGSNAIRYKMLQNFGQSFVLQMNDEMDYTGILGSIDGVLPSKIKGRGIIKRDAVYEFQTAYSFEPDEMYDCIRKYCAEEQKKSKTFAPSVPVLPSKVDSNFLENHKNTLQSTPIGVSKNSLQVVSADFSDVITIVSSLDLQALSLFSQGLAEIFSKNIDMRTVVYDFEPSYVISGFENYKYISNDAESEIVALFKTMLDRHNQLKENNSLKFPTFIYIINNYSFLMTLLSEDGKDKLNVLLDKANATYNMHFVICDTANNLQKTSMLPWYRNHCTKGNGVWIGDGVSNQYHLKISKMSSELNREVGNDFGFVIKNGKYQICKIIQPENCIKEDDVDG